MESDLELASPRSIFASRFGRERINRILNLSRRPATQAGVSARWRATPRGTTSYSIFVTTPANWV